MRPFVFYLCRVRFFVWENQLFDRKNTFAKVCILCSKSSTVSYLIRSIKNVLQHKKIPFPPLILTVLFLFVLNTDEEKRLFEYTRSVNPLFEIGLRFFLLLLLTSGEFVWCNGTIEAGDKISDSEGKTIGNLVDFEKSGNCLISIKTSLNTELAKNKSYIQAVNGELML